jgi:tRNA-(ms[2]io[6]A)-hydroxylase
VLKLASATDPAWAPRAARQADAILVDHAHLEKKAAGMAMTLLFQYPDEPALQLPLASLAREELAHFEEVLAHLARRGVPFVRTRASAYAGRLRRLIRPDEPERLLDLLLCAAVIEARSCERLGLLAEALDDPELAHFYRALRTAEARHHGLYVELACTVAEPDAVAERLEAITCHEAAVLAELPVEPRLHGNA